MNAKRKKPSKKSSKGRASRRGGESDRIAVPTDQPGLEKALEILRDEEQPERARCDALQAIQAASFAVLEFDAIRSDYLAALRSAAQGEHRELRQRALGILAREHDGFAQKALVEGLRDPDKALVPPEKALQLLSYDPHTEAYSEARKVVKDPPSEDARREALRVLAGDPKSASTFERILDDKEESTELRRLSAAALHSLRPDKLQRWAQEAVLDKREDTEVVVTCLTALDQFGDEEGIKDNAKLRRRIGELRSSGKGRVKSAASKLVKKYGI